MLGVTEQRKPSSPSLLTPALISAVFYTALKIKISAHRNKL